MKVSEKSLELNVGAELLNVIRYRWGLPKAYLRGLTQREEKVEGVDFFAQLSSSARLFAFQFKAPLGTYDSSVYRYRLVREQHNPLFALARIAPASVFYVFPFYVTPVKLQRDVPNLSQDTWLLRVALLPTATIFGVNNTKIIRCWAGLARINPEYSLQTLTQLSHGTDNGISAREFATWYEQHIAVGHRERTRRNPWLVRGLRIVVVEPQPRLVERMDKPEEKS